MILKGGQSRLPWRNARHGNKKDIYVKIQFAEIRAHGQGMFPG